MTYNILSPDRIPISPDNFADKKTAEKYFKLWVKRYEKQGYYSSNNGRIPYDQIAYSCMWMHIE